LAAKRQLQAVTTAGKTALAQSLKAGSKASAESERALRALATTVGRLLDRAIDEMLLADERVGSAGEGLELLAGGVATEKRAEEIQRLVVASMPVVRALARGARFVKLPWVILASRALSVGVAVSSGVREIRVISSLVAHRLEQESAAPVDPALVKKLAVDLYLHPRRELQLRDDKLRLVALTRRWVLGGLLGRRTHRRTGRALDAAEQFDPAATLAAWRAVKGPLGRL
jgi:hypothetical protein